MVTTSETTTDDPVLEIELEDHGGASWLRRLATTLTGQYGTLTYRFVARRRGPGAGQHAGTVAVSETFPVMAVQLPLDELQSRDAWANEIQDALQDLERSLQEEGWQPAGRGAHWWSKIYVRPSRTG